MTAHDWAPCSSARPVEVRLSTVEVEACFELLGLGEPPPSLQLPSPGRTLPERQNHLDAVLLGLRRRGLADRNRPSEELAGPLRVLARPDRQLDLRIHSPHGELVAIAAAARRNGALAVRQGDQMTIGTVRRTALVPAVVGLIGPMTPGPGATVNVPADLFEEAWETATDRHPASLVDRLTEMGIPRRDVSSLIHMCRGTGALGQIGAVHYDGRSARPSPWVIGFHRTDAGYYLLLRKPSAYGGATVTIRPLDAPRLAQLAEELLNNKGTRRPQHRHAW
jgi:hypothetical protein